jgi:hypothetical protein
MKNKTRCGFLTDVKSKATSMTKEIDGVDDDDDGGKEKLVRRFVEIFWF